MKQYISFLFILFTGLACWSCKEDVERPELVTSEIELAMPKSDVSIDLDKVRQITFAWTDAFLVDKYNLLLSTHEEMSNPVVVETRRTPHLISSSDMNDIAAKLGIASGYTGKIYWTVQSGKSSQPSVAEIRSLTVTRLMAQPLTPIKGTTFELNNEALDTEVKFTWEPMPDTESYQLLISANADLSDPLVDAAVEKTSTALTHRQLQDIVDNKAAGLKRYKANTLYWNVKVGDRLMASSAWTFKLYGTKIFTDVRGDESITYKVAVLPNGDSEVVWLAENLRTTRLNTGEPLVYEGQANNKSQYFPGAEAKKNPTTPIAEAIRKVAGMYYRVGMIGNNSPSVVWPGMLAPKGWKVPELQDFVNLAKMSLATCDYLEVLRCAEAYPALQIGDKKLKKDLINAWGMNMAPCGTNRDSGGSMYIAEFGDLDGLHMVYAINNSISQFATLEIAAATGKGGARAIALGKNAPIVVRLIYTGDD